MLFDAGVAAGSASAFAALLAAIVLAVLGQIATTVSRDTNDGHMTERRGYQLSLTAGPSLIALLLGTTYMFVLLSGRTTANGSGRLLQLATQANLRASALGFAICGSCLAVYAAATAAFIRLVIAESRSQRTLADASASAVVTGLILGDAIFLVFGYDDIFTAFSNHRFSAGLWFAEFATMLAPIAMSLSVRPPRIARAQFEDVMTFRRAQFAVLGVLAFAGVIPVILFSLAIRHHYSGSTDYDTTGIVVCTWAASAWSGILFAGISWTSRVEIN